MRNSQLIITCSLHILNAFEKFCSVRSLLYVLCLQQCKSEQTRENFSKLHVRKCIWENAEEAARVQEILNSQSTTTSTTYKDLKIYRFEKLHLRECTRSSASRRKRLTMLRVRNSHYLWEILTSCGKFSQDYLCATCEKFSVVPTSATCEKFSLIVRSSHFLWEILTISEKFLQVYFCATCEKFLQMATSATREKFSKVYLCAATSEKFSLIVRSSYFLWEIVTNLLVR